LKDKNQIELFNESSFSLIEMMKLKRQKIREERIAKQVS
jgi:hypothetical protein